MKKLLAVWIYEVCKKSLDLPTDILERFTVSLACYCMFCRMTLMGVSCLCIKGCVAEHTEEVCMNQEHGFQGTTGLGDGQAVLISFFHLHCLQFCFHIGFSLVEIFILLLVAFYT